MTVRGNDVNELTLMTLNEMIVNEMTVDKMTAR